MTSCPSILAGVSDSKNPELYYFPLISFPWSIQNSNPKLAMIALTAVADAMS